MQIPDRADCAKALVPLARRGRVDCYRDNVFIVPEPALDLLRELNVTYLELGRGGFDFVVKAWRDVLDAQTRDSPPGP